MAVTGSTQAWQGYAVTGRPDFLNYLHRGDVTWSELWDFYRELPAERDPMLRLVGLFHIFLCQEYEEQGSVLDPEGSVCAQLKEWVSFVLESSEWLPEEALRETLSALLAQSLITPLYYEAAFSVYLAGQIDRCREVEAALQLDPTPTDGLRLAVRLPATPTREAPAAPPEAVASALARHYPEWDRSFRVAMGEEDDRWVDPGGEA